MSGLNLGLPRGGAASHALCVVRRDAAERRQAGTRQRSTCSAQGRGY